MKKIFFGALLLALIIAASIPTMAMAGVNINIGLPPLIAFGGPPELIVLPDTYVYVAPDVDADLFFWNGWWWRLWNGRWYRSHYYNRGWGYYNNIPSFYFDVDPGWRGYYRDHNWNGHRWDYERIPDQRLQQNWKSWQSNRHWERQGTWGVQGYQPQPQPQLQKLRQQRQQQYQQKPEVQQQIQPKVQQQIQPKVQQQIQPKVQQQKQPKVQQQKKQYQQKPEVQQQEQQSHEKAQKQQKGPKGRSEKDKEDNQDVR